MVFWWFFCPTGRGRAHSFLHHKKSAFIGVLLNLRDRQSNGQSSRWKKKDIAFWRLLDRPVSHGRTVLAPQNVSYKWRIVKFAWSQVKRSVELLKKQIQWCFGRILALQSVSYKLRIVKFALSPFKLSVELLRKLMQIAFWEHFLGTRSSSCSTTKRQLLMAYC